MTIRDKKDKYIIKLSHKELVLLSCDNLDLKYVNSQLFDCDEFSTEKDLLKAYAKIYKKINKKLKKVNVY